MEDTVNAGEFGLEGINVSRSTLTLHLADLDHVLKIANGLKEPDIGSLLLKSWQPLTEFMKPSGGEAAHDRSSVHSVVSRRLFDLQLALLRCKHAKRCDPLNKIVVGVVLRPLHASLGRAISVDRSLSRRAIGLRHAACGRLICLSLPPSRRAGQLDRHDDGCDCADGLHYRGTGGDPSGENLLVGDGGCVHHANLDQPSLISQSVSRATGETDEAGCVGFVGKVGALRF